MRETVTYLEPVFLIGMVKTARDGAGKILRIHGARSRPIIHLERSASASPLEFAPDPTLLRTASQVISVVSDCADAVQNCAAGMRLYPCSPRPHSCARNNPLIGLLSRTPDSRYAWRTWFPAALIVAHSLRRRRAALLCNYLHQLHRLPATRAT